MSTQSVEQGSLPPLTQNEQEGVQAVVRAAQSAQSQQAIEHALMHAIIQYRAYAIRAGALYIAPSAVMNTQRLMGIMDFVWLGFEPYWRRMVRPLFMAQIYAGAVRDARSRIPEHIAMAMADDYARRLGTYFNQTTAASMAEGYNAYVNRRVAVKMAADRALRTFGMTRRQVAAFINSHFETQKVSSVQQLDPRRQSVRYLETAFRQRIGNLAKQETYNMSQEGQQVNWLYQAREGVLPETAKKIWITADDERVCPLCGPMHRKKVAITEHFVLPDKTKVWTPGIHPSCRCTMRLSINTREVFGKADNWGPEDEAKIRRDNAGRFAPKGRGPSVLERARQTNTLEQATFTQLQDLLRSAPVEETVDLSQTTKKVNLVARKVDLSNSTKTVDLSGTKADLTSATKSPAVQLNSTDSKAVSLTDLGQKIKTDLSAQVAQAISLSNTVKPPSLSAPGTIILDKAVFTLAPHDDWELDYDEHGEIQAAHISSTHEFTDERALLPQLHKNIDELLDAIARKVGDAADRGDLELHEMVDGDWAHGNISTDDAYQAVYAASRGEHLEDQFVDVPLFQGGEIISHTPISFGEIIGKLEVDPNDFVQRVYRIDEVYSNDAVTHDPGSRHGFESWRTEGVYDATVMARTSDNYGLPVEIIYLTPKAED